MADSGPQKLSGFLNIQQKLDFKRCWFGSSVGRVTKVNKTMSASRDVPMSTELLDAKERKRKSTSQVHLTVLALICEGERWIVQTKYQVNACWVELMNKGGKKTATEWSNLLCSPCWIYSINYNWLVTVCLSLIDLVTNSPFYIKYIKQ